MSKYIKKTKKNGFTIIEMMIAIAIFLVVVIYGMQALLNANLVHRKSQDMRSVMDSLNFALEEMSKNIRIGYNYHCIKYDSDFGSITTEEPNSCEDGIGVAFESATDGEPGNGNDQWAYFIVKNSIFKSTGPTYGYLGSDDVRLISEDIVIDEINSGFDVLGAESPIDGDEQQPLVIIRLSGEIKGKNNTSTPFSIQTSVSQRLVDIVSQNIVIPPTGLPTGLAGAEAQSLESQSVEAQEVQSEEQATPQSVEAAP